MARSAHTLLKKKPIHDKMGIIGEAPMGQGRARHMPVDDEQLLTAAHRGDREALGVLLERHAADLREKVQGRIPMRHQSMVAADDILQVTYLEAVLRFATFKASGPGAFGGWLYCIAEHNLLDAIRELEAGKRPDPTKRVQPRGEDSVVALYDLLTGTTTSPSGQCAKREATELLRACLKRLPEDYRQVVQLYDLEYQTVSEVAARMNRSTGAVFMLRARAHERLRELLPAASKLLGDSA